MPEPYYQKYLATIHSRGFTRLARAAGAWICKELATDNLVSGTVTDLGCGGGDLLEIVRQKGFAGIGCDLSPHMLALARDRLPDTTFFEADIWKFPLSDSVAVAAIGEVINYAPAFEQHDNRLSALCDNVYRSLDDGGIFLLDFRERSLLHSSTPRSFEFKDDDWWCRVQYDFAESSPHLMRHIEYALKDAQSNAKPLSERHVLYLYDQADVLRILENAGFTVQLNDHYPEVEPLLHHKVVIARKEK